VTDPASSASFTTNDWLLLAIICSPIAALCAWGVVRVRQARAAIRAALRNSGLELVRFHHRFLRLGPFWTRARTHVVYRVTVRDAHGRERTGWAQWGRAWLFSPDTLEFRWDE
jgi:hypothetical protein